MDVENNHVELEEQPDLSKDEEFREAVYTRMRSIHNQGMIVGFQTACHSTLEKIYAFERKPGSKSTNDYKRLVKEIKRFCEIGVSRKTKSNDTTEPIETNTEETIQN